LISCKGEDCFSFDLEALTIAMQNILPSNLLNLFIANSVILGKNHIVAKKQFLQKRITKFAIAAAVSDIVPFAGTVVDVIIIVAEVKHYRKCFGLTSKDFEGIASYLNVDDISRNTIAKVVGIDGKYVHIKNLVMTTLSAVSIPVGSIIANAVVGAVSLGVGVATLGIGFAISAAISGPISYVLTKKVLTKILNDMEADSLKMIDLLLEAKKEQRIKST